MRNSDTFLTQILPASTSEALARIAKATDASFSEQVQLAGIDRLKDLKQADLRNVDISYSDLRGFNLTGADLRGVTGIYFQKDNSTILDGADLEGSVFAAKARLAALFETDERARNVLKSVNRASVSGQLEWAVKNLQATGKYHDIAIPVTEALLYRSSNDFLRAEFMRYLAPRIESREALKEMLLTAISDHPESSTIVGGAVQLFRRHGMSQDSGIRQTAIALLDSSAAAIKAAALRFLMRTQPTLHEYETIKAKAISGDEQLGPLFVAEVASDIGETCDLATRDPITNGTFAPNAIISAQTRLLIARRWLRTEAGPDKNNLDIPMIRKRLANHEFSNRQIEQRAEKLDEIWKELSGLGIEFVWAPASAV
ncbi:pentapeptide repeat-containing protein [Mesorhizobium sp. B3-1-7]|uniref:pentapeptide repeat-containing protein n=1 Tax=Mesorhizobium sp. B3-1-7 TaxID=2589894 RepID=UPI00112CC1D3|nr:pentapeptide repeat-containing protein [Mesorhizobium sp. B3-1-7]TPI63950.1 pentapeptide repeat-containing protein [Mesorhizobium sp. B3-1-7]